MQKPSSASSSYVSVSTLANTDKQTSKWVIDSGATDHMSGNSRLFTDLKMYEHDQAVILADGSQSNVQGTGNINISPPLKSALFIPSLSYNLLSVSQLTKSMNYSISFFPKKCVF